MDGLLLNFAPDQAAPGINFKTVASNLKKGSWMRKRIDAKRIIHRVNKEAKLNAPVLPIAPSLPSPKVVPEPEPKGRKHTLDVETTEMNAKRYKNKSSSIFTQNPVRTLIAPVSSNVEKKETSVFTDDTFAGLGINQILCSHLAGKLNVEIPTPIQQAAIPVLLGEIEKDVIIQAQTGSGKTYAFILPIINRILESAARNPKEFDFFSRTTGALAIILTPTRELAAQISLVLESLLSYFDSSKKEGSIERYRHWIVSGIVTGGESRKSEKARLRKGVNVLVCTPGRLLDHLRTTDSFTVGNLRWLVLDEADNLLNLGFEETLREILAIIDLRCREATRTGVRVSVKGWPKDRQIVLCSATIEKGVQELAKQTLVDPIFINADSSLNINADSNEKGKVLASQPTSDISVPQQMKQMYLVSPAKLRLVSLVGLLRKITDQMIGAKVLVFISTGDSVDWHYDAISRIGESENILDPKPSSEIGEDGTKAKPLVKVIGSKSTLLSNATIFKLHGTMTQSDRQATYAAFSAPQTSVNSVLFCTDVAARGLDLPDITNVIQYNPPTDSRDYIHRIGRTARLGRPGTTHLFLMPGEVEYLETLLVYKCELEEEPSVPILKTLLGLQNPLKPTSKVGNKHLNYEIAATDLHMLFERFVNLDAQNAGLARKAYMSAIRAYATHTQADREIFHVRKLHLGHFAKSFGLSETPVQILKTFGANSTTEKKGSSEIVSAQDMRKFADRMQKRAMVSEFSSGISSGVNNDITVGKKRGLKF